MASDRRKKPPPDQLQLYTIPEAAKVLGVSRSHAYRVVADGDLRVIDVGRRGGRKPMSRVRADDLADFIAGRTEP
ncbi:helix-turn-helix domain-containing protein [Nonomuraea lactucae]|uniref:helix-turn-helix domain-containing protein n=1 Tax=Nonomuraea lactucae TaxID=2249762 RepID=UPI0013B35D79|nr:helix-turn-helix domain-containing protein [Nonomuraea lactucae]